MIRVTCRLSRLIRDATDSWGLFILGSTIRVLQQHLDRRAFSNTVKPISGPPTSTTAGTLSLEPPSVLRLFFTKHAPVKSLPRQKLRISTLIHALDDLAEDEIDYIVGDSTLLDLRARSQYVFLSLGNTAEYKYTVWRDLLRRVVLNIGTKPLTIRQGLQALDGLLNPIRGVTLLFIAPTSYLSVVSGFSSRAVGLYRSCTSPHACFSKRVTKCHLAASPSWA